MTGGAADAEHNHDTLYAFIQHFVSVCKVTHSSSVSTSNPLVSHRSVTVLCLPAVLPDDWERAFPVAKTRVAQYPADAHRPHPSSGFPLTVKDLLLSGTPEHVSWSAGSRAHRLADSLVVSGVSRHMKPLRAYVSESKC